MLPKISPTSIISGNSLIGDDSIIQEFVIIGGLHLSNSENDSLITVGTHALIRSHSVIYNGNRIGDNFQTGHGVLIRESNIIGNLVSIGTHSVIEHHVRIGNGVRVHSNVFIPEYTVIEDGAWIGPNVVLTNALYPANPTTKMKLQGVHILQNAKVGANATILPGITIGRDALVGAGSVVTHDVPDGKVVSGNPARVMKNISEIPDYQTLAEQ